MITLSTYVTLLRIFFTPFIIASMIMQMWGMAAVLFVLAAFTDMIDGKLARMRNEVSNLGASLDPVADKVLLLSTYTALCFIETPLFVIPSWFLYIVVIKEALQVFGAACLFALKKKPKIEATLLGKATTVVQFLFIVWLFMCYFMHWLPVKTYSCMLGLVLALMGATFIQYAQIGYKMFLGKE